MSSPNAKEEYSAWDRLRIRFHQGASHHHRVRLLVAALAEHLPQGGSLLDVGCGDLSLAAGLAAARGLRRCVGADIWPQRSEPPLGCEYRRIDVGGPLPWDAGEFDVVMLADTLHHLQQPGGMLAEALRVGGKVVVKDHFEYGATSRFLLQLLDYVGNSAYGVPVPGRYFTRESFDALVKGVDPAVRAQVRIGLDLYGHLPLGHWVFPPKLHFIADLERPRAPVGTPR